MAHGLDDSLDDGDRSSFANSASTNAIRTAARHLPRTHTTDRRSTEPQEHNVSCLSAVRVPHLLLADADIPQDGPHSIDDICQILGISRYALRRLRHVLGRRQATTRPTSLLDRCEPTGSDIVDEPAHWDVLEEQGCLADRRNVIANTLHHIGKGQEVDRARVCP